MIPEIEKENPAFIKKFQEKKLKNLLQYLEKNSPFYQKLFAKHNININEIVTIEDLKKIPTTDKNDLQKFNQDFFATPKARIVDFSTTSGTTGSPVTIPLSEKDLERLAYNEAISLSCAGVNENSIVQILTTIDQHFMAGLAYFLGCRKIGASIIRTGNSPISAQWNAIFTHQPDFLIVVPSFLLKMINFAKKNKIDYQISNVKNIVCIGESIRNEDFSLNTLGKKISEKWKNIQLFSTYASSEMRTTFTECSAQKGGHHHPELLICEILDSNENPVELGGYGELTITTLDTEAMPLLRFKTGDVVKIDPTPCSCSRTTFRISPVLGRKNQMIKYKGTTLYPPALINVLNDFEEIENYLIEISHNENLTDEILVKISCQNASHDLKQKIQERFKTQIRVTPNIEFWENHLLEKEIFSTEKRKPIRFIDKRF